MRRVWLFFKLLESIFGLICIGYHYRGFLSIEFVRIQFSYCAVFGGFTLMAMFNCLSIIMKQKRSPLWEGSVNLVAAIAFFAVSLNSMFHAEKDFYLTYLAADEFEEAEEAEEEEYYPYFNYSKSQSVSALCAGCAYFLHSVLAFDVSLNDKNFDSDNYEYHEDKGRNVRLYFCGRAAHLWLDKYEWFHSMSDEKVRTPR